LSVAFPLFLAYSSLEVLHIFSTDQFSLRADLQIGQTLQKLWLLAIKLSSSETLKLCSFLLLCLTASAQKYMVLKLWDVSRHQRKGLYVL